MVEEYELNKSLHFSPLGFVIIKILIIELLDASLKQSTNIRLFVWLISHHQQYFSLITNQPPTTSQQYFSLRTNQHQRDVTQLVERHQ
jgi:hypothetical protein